MVREYEIIDIYHTGNHGPKGVRKKGFKYDTRRGEHILCNIENYNPGENIVFGKGESPYLWTTPYVQSYFKDDLFYIETINSIYELKIIREVE